MRPSCGRRGDRSPRRRFRTVLESFALTRLFNQRERGFTKLDTLRELSKDDCSLPLIPYTCV